MVNISITATMCYTVNIICDVSSELEKAIRNLEYEYPMGISDIDARHVAPEAQEPIKWLA